MKWTVKLQTKSHADILSELLSARILSPAVIRLRIRVNHDWTAKAKDRAGDDEAGGRCRQVLSEENAGKEFVPVGKAKRNMFASREYVFNIL